MHTILKRYRPTFSLLGAALLFAMLSIANDVQHHPSWVMVRSVTAGNPVTAQDVRKVYHPASIHFVPGQVARVTLMAGQTLVSGDLTGSSTARQLQLSLPVSASQAQEIRAGDQIRFATVKHGKVWTSPIVTVSAVMGGGLMGATSSVMVSGNWSALHAILANLSSEWMVVKEGRGGSH